MSRGLILLLAATITADASGQPGNAANADPIRSAVEAVAEFDSAESMDLEALIRPMDAAKKADVRSRLDLVDRKILSEQQTREMAAVYRLLGTNSGERPSGAILAREASQALAVGRYDEAFNLATEALKSDPNNKDALSVYHSAKGRTTEKPRTASGPPRPSAGTDIPQPAERGSVILQAAAPKRPASAPPSPSSSSEYDAAKAIALLHQTPSGRTAAEYISARKIPVRVGTMPEGSAAMYVPAENVIYVPPDFQREPLIVQAVLLGHEGAHAVQSGRDGSGVCLESELDAGMKHRMIYAELVEAGIDPMPSNHYLEQQYVAMRKAIAKGRPGDVYSSIAEEYRLSTKNFDRERIRNSWPVLRPLSKAVIAVIGPYNMPNTRWAAEFKRHWWHSAVAPNAGLAAVTRSHEIERKEAIQWFDKRRSVSQ